MNSHQVGIPRAVLARAITAVIAGSHQCRMTNSRAESQLSGAHQLRQTDSLTSRDTGATKPERFDSSTTVIKGMSGRRQDRKQVDLVSINPSVRTLPRTPKPFPPLIAWGGGGGGGWQSNGSGN